MKGSGWIGILLIGVGALMVYAGFTNQPLVAILAAVLSNKPLPKNADATPPATEGSTGGTGFKPDTGAAGQGATGGGGGGW